jgi:integrase
MRLTGKPTGKRIRVSVFKLPDQEVRDGATTWFGSRQAALGWPLGRAAAAGRWFAQIRLPRNRRELITRLQEERWRLACGIPVRARGLSLADYAKQWLEVMRCRLRPTTFAGYELCLGRAVRMLGAVPVVRLTPQLIQACYAGLLAEGLSPRTVFHTHAVLHRALKQARNWGLTRGNPTELVSVPRPPYREMRALSKAQLEVLFETSRETRWYPLWVLLGTTGLRIGEALGLKWSDVDLLAGRVQVRRALQRQRGRGLVFVEPKSVTSRRCVELPQLAITVLAQQRLRVEGELVFPNRDGEPTESSTVTEALKVALDRAGLPRIRVHDLRHTTATVLLEAGVHPKLVQHLLGHSTVALTLNTYSHVTPGLNGEVARMMDRLLGRGGSDAN